MKEFDHVAFKKRLNTAIEDYNENLAFGEEPLNLSRLGSRVGIAYSRIAAWNNGSHVPSEKSLRAIAIVLRVPYEWLFYGTHEREYPKSTEEYKRSIIEYVKHIDDQTALSEIEQSIEGILQIVPDVDQRNEKQR